MEREKRQEQLEVRGAETERAAVEVEGLEGGEGGCRGGSGAAGSYYGGPDYKCPRCHAVFWWRERVQSLSAITKRRVVYNLCCKGGKVRIPPFQKPPAFLNELLNYTGPPQTLLFIKKIRQYNCLFAFTSMGAKIDRSINNGGGPNIFKINGQVCHRIGSILSHL